MTKKLDPDVEMSPACVSKFKSGKGQLFKMTFSNPPKMSKEDVKEKVKLFQDSESDYSYSEQSERNYLSEHNESKKNELESNIEDEEEKVMFSQQEELL